MFQCSVCAYESNYKFNVDRHEKAKHQAGSGAVKSIQEAFKFTRGKCRSIV